MRGDPRYLKIHFGRAVNEKVRRVEMVGTGGRYAGVGYLARKNVRVRWSAVE